MNADVHDDLTAFALDSLPQAERTEFSRHLAGCARCREELAAMRGVTSQLADASAATPPASLRASVLDRIAETPQDRPEPSTAAPAGQGSDGTGEAYTPPSGHPVGPGETEPASTETVASPRASVIPLVRSTGGRAATLVAAAAVVFALAVGGWAIHVHSSAQQTAGQAQALSRLLAARDVQTASGTFTSGGSGTVVVSASQHTAMLVTSGLPSLPAGKVYEAWTIRNGAAPAGTFGSSSATAILRLPPAAFHASQVAVTVEPAGGSPHPTTHPIFAVAPPAG